jgi:hypothetical protein
LNRNGVFAPDDIERRGKAFFLQQMILKEEEKQ